MAIKKFVKFDSEKGYLDNKDDINYFSASQMRKVAFGGMLGDFDENGLYVINQKIVAELIKMPKVIVEMVEDADLIRSKIKGDAFFHFILTVEDNKASLKLLEKIFYQSNRDFNSGVYSNINEYVLDEVVVPDKDFDRNALYQKYNIDIENDGETLSIFDMDELSLALYYNLIQKIKTNYLVQNELILKEKELEAMEADYFESMLEVLAQFADFGDRVKTAVQEDLAEKHNFMIISKPFFQKTVNEVLDSYVDQFVQDLSPEQKEQFLEKVRAIKEQYYQKFKKLLPVEIARKSGVRFDPNQIVEETIIGSLAQEITTKGYTSSDVRRIVIKDDELQLSISKIKEIVKENEDACKRDNTKAKDITKDRKLTSEFYQELGTKKKTDLLTPNTNLIKNAITVQEEVKVADVSSNNAKTQTSTAGAGTGAKTDNKKTNKTSNTKVSGKSSAKQVKAGNTKPQKGSSRTDKTSQKTDERILTGTLGAFGRQENSKKQEINAESPKAEQQKVKQRDAKKRIKEETAQQRSNLMLMDMQEIDMEEDIMLGVNSRLAHHVEDVNLDDNSVDSRKSSKSHNNKGMSI